MQYFSPRQVGKYLLPSDSASSGTSKTTFPFRTRLSGTRRSSDYDGSNPGIWRQQGIACTCNVFLGKRQSLIRTFRDNLPDEVRKPKDGVECMRCHQSIPYCNYFYSCPSSTSAKGQYVVCEGCHKKGLSCLDFRHPPILTTAFPVCRRCNVVVKDAYTWRCDICDGGKYEVCWKCYTSGANPGHGCLVDGHRLHKRLQRCFEGWGYHKWIRDICDDDCVWSDPH